MLTSNKNSASSFTRVHGRSNHTVPPATANWVVWSYACIHQQYTSYGVVALLVSDANKHYGESVEASSGLKKSG